MKALSKAPTVAVSTVLLALFTLCQSGSAETFKVNFQLGSDPLAEPFSDYLIDSGAAFGDRGDGNQYGWYKWDTDSGQWVLSSCGNTRKRGIDRDPRWDTLNHMQKRSTETSPAEDYSWEISLPTTDNNLWNVAIVTGDPESSDPKNHLLVEGIEVNDPTPAASHFDEYLLENVLIEDGRLTVRPNGGYAKINFLIVSTEEIQIDHVPEPATLALLGVFLPLGFFYWRRRRSM